MHESAAPRNSASPQTETGAAANGPSGTGWPLAALLCANAALAFGPWLVRLADVGPVSAAFWRIALAAPVLVAASYMIAPRPFASARVLAVPLLVAGLAFAGDLASWHLGILRTTMANATLFGNSATLMFPIYGFIIVRAWPNRTQGLALLLAAVGAALLLGRSYQLSAANLVGDLLCLLGGLLYTVYFIGMARARAAMAPVQALTLSSLASVGPLLLFALLLGEQVWPNHWGPLVGLALASQLIGQGLMIYALGRLPPLVVGIALLTQPVIGGTVGWLVYGEVLGAADFLGAALVAVALVLVRRPG